MLSEVMWETASDHSIPLALLVLVVVILLCIFVRESLFAGTTAKDANHLRKSSSTLYRISNLPGVPFKFPNGQGTEKFFDGRRAAQRWRSQYGSMYSIWSGFKREIVISEPKHVQEFYTDSHMHIKAADNNSGWLFGELLGSCVGLVSQQQWRRVRKPFECHFTRSASMGRAKSFVNEADAFFRTLNGSGKELIINTTNDLKYCPFFMVAGIFFGDLTAEQRDTLRMLAPPREELFRATFLGGVNRYAIAKYLPGSAMPRLRDFQRNWEAFARKACDEARRKANAVIVSLWEALERGEMSMPELLQTLDESLFANLDVTAHALSWNVIKIAEHTDIQQKLRLEMDMHNKSESEDEYENYLCREDTLLAACIIETSRLHPILPFSNPEAADVDKILDGYVIPRNTDIIVDAYAINIDNPYWEDSSRFNPYRHLGQKDQARRYNMWRFGFGPRKCLGKNVADIILRVIVAEMMRRYELKAVQEQGVDGVELQADSWIGLPNGGVKLIPL